MLQEQNDIKNLTNSFRAGKSTLNEIELKELIANSADFICAGNNIKIDNDQDINYLSDFFKAIQEGEFLKEFMLRCSDKGFFNLGKLLKKILKKNKSNSAVNLTYQYLNFFRTSEFLQKIENKNKWTDLISGLIDLSDFNTRRLFNQRYTQHPQKTLFKVLKGDKIRDYSWKEINEQVEQYQQSLLTLVGERKEKPRVAFLMENSLTMAILDLACLNSGIINVMIPANSVPQHISYILNQSQADFVLISNEKQLAKLKTVKNELTELKKGILIDGVSSEDWVISFKEFLSLPKEKIEIVDLDINSQTTVMYTSGTTGEPKGIIFTQKNIVFKRFCRAVALPKINDEDSFLAYLPLYHTFGRWLELMGAIFWGAAYSFMENPSAETMILNMKMVQPSIFISIPKKWVQLYEHITAKIDIENDEKEVILEEVKKVTGGNLKWGLSAAGYLDPDVFQFFQANGIQLMSGFGMTEATGGITMTPPNNYTPNSLGQALPGIEIKLAEDGELLVRGDYVMLGYFGQSYDETFLEDGWFPTGDIMKMDSKGFIEIIDRKKEIYKNIKGETIAPQRIENLFRDFDPIKQVFVVGDHRPFNTVLIYPDLESSVLKDMYDDQKGEYFSNLIVTINKFLAPFERIVDFRIINRAFSAENGELTPKNTYKRRIIEDNFKEIISELYKKDYYSLYLDNTEIKIPNWFLRERGCLTGDIKIEDSKIVIPKLEKSLRIERIEQNIFRIGDFSYNIKKSQVDLHEFLINPIYWLGNEDLVSFTDEAILQWYRQSTEEEYIKFHSSYFTDKNFNLTKNILSKINSAGEKSLFGLHLALVLLQSDNKSDGEFGLEYLAELLDDQTQEIYRICFYYLNKPNICSNIETQKGLFKLALKNIKSGYFREVFEKYLKTGSGLFDTSVREHIVKSKTCYNSVDTIDEILHEQIQLNFLTKDIESTVIPSLFDIFVRFGVKHPTKYEDIRRKFVRIQLLDDWNELSIMAQEYRAKMRKGFRKWLDVNETVAVDVETGEEYGWEEVIIFEEDLAENERELLTGTISSTPILREAVFLFSKGAVIRLSNILPRGIWVSKIRDEKKITVYRVSIQTRHQGSFDVLLHHNKNKSKKEIKEEVNWLILAGSDYFVTELVEDFGGYWETKKIWSQKYQPGLTVAHLFNRDFKKDKVVAEEKYYYLWPFFIWNAAAAYINFWRLTSGKMQLSNPTAENIIIPSHDYQVGTRFVSLSERSEFSSYIELFQNFYKKFVVPIEEKYPSVKRESSWKYIFPGLINAEGENEGIEILNYLVLEIKESSIEGKDEFLVQLQRLLESIKENGYIPKELYFATKRFIRWNKLNPDASTGAQAQMLNELYDTYNLAALENIYPETRTRFYLETVFKHSKSDFVNQVKTVCKLQHRRNITKDDFLKQISSIQKEFELNENEIFFLTRLSYPHLKPSDSASFLNFEVEGDHTANLVVQTEDNEGNPFYIRKPITPKEISKLYQLFLDANLQVTFKPEHQFLVAISDRGFIIGGLFYSKYDENLVHMEKIVVSNRVRRHGVSEAIMNEFFSRMKDEGNKNITTGFFRPEYFYKFGFKIEKKYSGLVKSL